jgi:hypothetical protein
MASLPSTPTALCAKGTVAAARNRGVTAGVPGLAGACPAPAGVCASPLTAHTTAHIKHKRTRIPRMVFFIPQRNPRA